MPDPIRLAIIGAGLIANAKHWPALAALPRDYRVVALVNRTAAKAEALAETIRRATGARPAVYSDYREMLDRVRPDAVSLALPPVLNPEVAEAALAAGCHVIAEKPLAASLADGARLLPWAVQSDRVLMIAENYRYKAVYQRAAGLIAAGTIGRPRVAHWTLYAYRAPDNPYCLTPWRQQPAHPGGFLSDGGVHHAAVLRMLLGEVEIVCAQVTSIRADMPPADTLHATLGFANGVLGTYAITYALPGPETPLHVVGADGALLVWQNKVELWRKDRPTEQWAAPSPVDGLVAMYEDFARAIRTGQPPLSTPAQALADLQLIVAMLRASETGQAVKVSDVA